MARKTIYTWLGRAAATFALGAVLLLSASSADAYKPANSHSCGKVTKSVTYKVYARHLSCDKGRRIFKKILRDEGLRNWNCELREFPNGAPGIACRSGKKRLYGISKE